MDPITISKQTARRFVLGRQGLWPGRRWRGKPGTAQALKTCEAVQLDPLNVIARSQDIVLHSRVLDYKPEYLQRVLYEDRGFFDYGAWLAVYPMNELPYWRVHMEKRSHQKRVEDFVFTHEALFDRVRAELRARGPLGNRDLDGNRVGSWNYRGRKDTSLALYDMWLSGELMMHHRVGFDRVYDFRENIAPREFDHVASEAEAIEFFARKAVSFAGLKRQGNLKAEWQYYLQRDFSRQEIAALLATWQESGMFAPVRVTGERETYLVLAEDLAALEKIDQGRLPKGWTPRAPTTLEEVTFLAPLDIVSARGRALRLFDFDYKWEVYVPAAKRRWGYYTLPILYGDRLVARLDPRLDRASRTLQIRGFWHETEAPVSDPAFARALGRGLLRFADFLGAASLNIAAIHPPILRKRLKTEVGTALRVSTAAPD